MKTQNLQLKMVCYWQSIKGTYSKDDPIKFLTRSLESCFCDYCDVYILVTGNITVTRTIAGNPIAAYCSYPSSI